MGGYRPVPLDQLPIPQAAESTQFKPAPIDQPPTPQPPGAGYMKTGGQIADVASNFLTGWLKGKQQAEQKKLAMAQQNMEGLHYGFQIAQQNAAQVAQDPSATPDAKAKAEQARQAAWKAYLDGAEQYTTPPKGQKSGGGGKGGGKGGQDGGIKAKLKQTFGAEDPHIFSQGAMALLRTTGPPALPPPPAGQLDQQNQMKVNKSVDALVDARSKGAPPEVIKKLEQDVKDSWARIQPPKPKAQFKVDDKGQPIPGQQIGEAAGTYWFPIIDEETGLASGRYSPTGPPKVSSNATEKSKEELIADYKRITPGASDKEAEDWYAKQKVRQENQKGAPTTSTSVVRDPSGVERITTTSRTKGGGAAAGAGGGAGTMQMTPGPHGSSKAIDWAVPAEGRKAIAKDETDVKNTKMSYDKGLQVMERIKKDPSYAAQGDVLLLSQHIGMTLHQAGIRPTKTMWDEARTARPWLNGIQVKFEGGLLTGAQLSPTQRQQMVMMMGDTYRATVDAANDDKVRYGVSVKLQAPDGTLGYVDKKTYEASKNKDFKGFTVINVE